MMLSLVKALGSVAMRKIASGSFHFLDPGETFFFM